MPVRQERQVYELDVLSHDIQTVKDNYTRFIALGREPAPRREGQAKTMLVMATSHQPGSLYKCLGILAAKQINLIKLELLVRLVNGLGNMSFISTWKAIVKIQPYAVL